MFNYIEMKNFFSTDQHYHFKKKKKEALNIVGNVLQGGLCLYSNNATSMTVLPVLFQENKSGTGH